MLSCPFKCSFTCRFIFQSHITFRHFLLLSGFSSSYTAVKIELLLNQLGYKMERYHLLYILKKSNHLEVYCSSLHLQKSFI